MTATGASLATARRPGSRRLAAWLLPPLLVTALALRLFFASGGLDYKRFFDERYSLDNVAAVLDGRFEPVWGWYPSLSYLPQAAVLAPIEALYRATGVEALRMRRGAQFTATGIAVCRAIGCLYGVAAIWLLYRIGRRMFDPATGLAAAFLFAALPEQVRLSAYIKPDSLMVLTLLAAFWLTLAAAARPSWRAFLATGAMIGLVGASKPYGVAAGAPLAVVAAVHLRRVPRVLLRLAGAAAAAVAVFLILNPHLGVLLEFAERNQAIYEGRGRGLGSVIAATARFPFEAHGPLVGGVAVAGLVLWGVRMVRGGGPQRQRVEAGLALALVAAYVALAWLLFRWAKANLWLPLLPFTSLAAADLLMATARATRHRLPGAVGTVAVAATLTLLHGLHGDGGEFFRDVAVRRSLFRGKEFLIDDFEEN